MCTCMRILYLTSKTGGINALIQHALEWFLCIILSSLESDTVNFYFQLSVFSTDRCADSPSSLGVHC